MLIATTLLGSLVGFYACFNVVSAAPYLRYAMRMCMLNSMSLAFLFAVFVELTTGSKVLATTLPMALVYLPIVLMVRPFHLLDLIESTIANLMSVAMSVMLVGMVSQDVIWIIQCTLVLIEMLLLFTLLREVHSYQMSRGLPQ